MYGIHITLSFALSLVPFHKFGIHVNRHYFLLKMPWILDQNAKVKQRKNE